MKHATLNVAALALMVGTLLGSSLTLQWVVNSYLGRYPGSTRLEGEGWHLPAITAGTVRLDSSYYTRDEIARVTGWYMRRYEVEPGPGMYTDGQCVKWGKSVARFIFHSSIAATLCSAGHGTRIHISQVIALAPSVLTGHR